MKENQKLIREIIEDVKRDMSDEETLNLLAGSKVSVNTAKESRKKYTVGQKAADKIAKFAGSWAFIFSFVGVLVLWMVGNVLLGVGAFDPYPFILLNLVLSCVAAIQAPLIMMSQNRQEAKDRERAENDYKVNLKTEMMIEDLYNKMNKILAKQDAILRMLREEESEELRSEEKKDEKKDEKKRRKIRERLLCRPFFSSLADRMNEIMDKRRRKW